MAALFVILCYILAVAFIVWLLDEILPRRTKRKIEQLLFGDEKEGE